MKTINQKAEKKLFNFNNDLNNFINSDNELKKAFQKYKINLSPDKTVYDFFFDEEIKNKKKLIELYLEANENLSKEETDELKQMNNSINSIFEVKNVYKDGFDLYNLVNEKLYNTKSLIKMVNYRNIFQGNFIQCRLIPFNDEFYLFSVDNVLKSSEILSAYRLAVSKQMEDPSLLYKDNELKIKEIEKNIELLAKKYENFFKNKEVITTNLKINNLLDAFNDYVEDENCFVNFENFITLPKKPEYFKINKNETSKKIYDIGIIFDPESGIHTIPFWWTFLKIFELENFRSIKNYQGCIKNFLNNEKIPPFAIKKVYEKFGNVFLHKIKEIINLKHEITFEELLHKYKSSYEEQKYFSSTTALYSSKAFEKLMELTSYCEDKNINEKKTNTGRNSPCPCGSGKKYKKCCLS